MTDGTPDLASSARRLLDWWDREGQRIVPPRASLQSVAVPRDEIAHLRAALAAHEPKRRCDGGRDIGPHWFEPGIDLDGILPPSQDWCDVCGEAWRPVSDTPEPPPEPCKTCQDRGWVWEGNASAGEGTPADCPDPVHASDYASADNPPQARRQEIERQEVA